jgi:(hydroxyamino)benzene mutase
MSLTSNAKRLVIFGAWLFVLGLIEGAAVPMFANPRMGLSAHLTAVQSGAALMILGVVWSLAAWSTRFENLSFWTILVGTYGLWLGLTLAAATGASQALPIAGHGYSASPVAEIIVSAFVMLSSGLMLIGWLLFAAGVTRTE